MYTIVGLGNPGEEYRMTRHNVGWQALEHFRHVKRLPTFVRSGAYNAFLSEGIRNGCQIGMLMPLTYMNRSGSSIVKYLKEQDGEISKLIVVHDDVDLPFGTIRISVGRGGGGHNGVQSVTESVGSSEYIRVRIGIARVGFFGTIKRPRGDRLANFVLGTFTYPEQEMLPEILDRVADALSVILEHGVVPAMNYYNS